MVEITSDKLFSTHIITSRKDNKAVFTFTDGAIAKEVSEIFRSLDDQVRVLRILIGNKAIENEIEHFNQKIDKGAEELEQYTSKFHDE